MHKNIKYSLNLAAYASVKSADEEDLFFKYIFHLFVILVNIPSRAHNGCANDG